MSRDIKLIRARRQQPHNTLTPRERRRRLRDRREAHKGLIRAFAAFLRSVAAEPDR